MRTASAASSREKIANLVITDGDIFADATNVKWIFIDGKLYAAPLMVEAPAGGAGRGGRAGGAGGADITGTWTLYIFRAGHVAGIHCDVDDGRGRQHYRNDGVANGNGSHIARAHEWKSIHNFYFGGDERANVGHRHERHDER